MRRQRKIDVSVTAHPDPELDWTPDELRIKPRVLRVSRGEVVVRLEEARGFGAVKYGVCAAIGGEWFELMSIEEFETIVDLLVEARNAARALGFPNPRGSLAGMNLPRKRKEKS